MRNLIRKWLGVDDIDNWIADNNEETNDIHKTMLILKAQIVELNMELDQAIKLPITFRIAQLENSARLITQFANELQRDIENKK